jgi:hypothetical protein
MQGRAQLSIGFLALVVMLGVACGGNADTPVTAPSRYESAPTPRPETPSDTGLRALLNRGGHFSARATISVKHYENGTSQRTQSHSLRVRGEARDGKAYARMSDVARLANLTQHTGGAGKVRTQFASLADSSVFVEDVEILVMIDYATAAYIASDVSDSFYENGAWYSVHSIANGPSSTVIVAQNFQQVAVMHEAFVPISGGFLLDHLSFDAYENGQLATAASIEWDDFKIEAGLEASYPGMRIDGPRIIRLALDACRLGAVKLLLPAQAYASTLHDNCAYYLRDAALTAVGMAASVALGGPVTALVAYFVGTARIANAMHGYGRCREAQLAQ